MSKLSYFKDRLESTISPMDFVQMQKAGKIDTILLDVRNAPPQAKQVKIAGALEIPQRDLADNLGKLAKNMLIVVYCWDVWCNLGAHACVTLLENGFDVKELSGGIAAWRELNLPTEQL